MQLIVYKITIPDAACQTTAGTHKNLLLAREPFRVSIPKFSISAALFYCFLLTKDAVFLKFTLSNYK